MAALTLDPKGRVTVPTRHRDLLSTLCDDQLTVTKHPVGCLLIFPRPAWHLFREQLLTMPLSLERFRRVFLGSAMDVEIDSGSRVLIAPELRTWAQLDREVTLLGVGKRLELWNREAYAAHEAGVLAEPLPESLQNFVM